MPYEYAGSSRALDLLTGRSPAENAHILAAYLQGDQESAPSKEVLLFSTCRKVFGGLNSIKSPSDSLWVALRQTGLIEILLDTLIKQDVWESEQPSRKDIDWGISELLMGLSIIVYCKPWRLDNEFKATVKVKIGEALRSVHSKYGLRSNSTPQALYKIQCITVMAMGILLTDLGAEYTFHDAASVPAFGTLALAVIFDPLADSGRIDGTPSHIAHRQARHILNALSCSQFSGCFQDIAPSVANKYGAKRITSICNSYFANPRYISRCYTGLGLCAAMASAKSLHPSFINEGKVHLTILRWFWKTFGEPQESHPDDKEYDDGKHDLKLLPGDSLSCLWTITCRLSSNLLKNLLHDLVVRGDLIMVLGHWYFAGAPISDSQDSACEGFIIELAERYTEDQRFVTLYIEGAWKHIFKTLNSAKRSGVSTWKGDLGIEIWRRFGETFGLVKRGSLDESHVQAVADFVKCESLICPLYGEYAFEKFEPGVSGMKCKRCQTVYCSLACQKTDWRSGRHQAVCKAE